MPQTLNSARIAVLGSNSFIASHFIAHALHHTDSTVLGISRSPELSPVFLPYAYKMSYPDRFQFKQIDINAEFTTLADALDNFHPDCVVNYAAQAEVRNSWKWPEQWYQTNCLSVVRLTEHLRQQNYLKKYIAISTPEVYGATGVLVKESHHYHPSTPYAASKLAGDAHLFALHKNFDFPVAFTRAANVYGIHQQLFRIIPKTIISIKKGIKLPLHGGGKSRRAFIHAADTADCTMRVLEQGDIGDVYHIAPQTEPISIAELVRLICTLMGKSFDDVVEVQDENFGQDECFSMDASKAVEKMGWLPNVSLEKGLLETIAWITDNWDFISKQSLDYEHKR